MLCVYISKSLRLKQICRHFILSGIRKCLKNTNTHTSAKAFACIYEWCWQADEIKVYWKYRFWLFACVCAIVVCEFVFGWAHPPISSNAESLFSCFLFICLLETRDLYWRGVNKYNAIDFFFFVLYFLLFGCFAQPK